MRSATHKNKLKQALDFGEKRLPEKFEVFRGLGASDIDRIVEAGIIRTLAGGKILFRKGDAGKEVFLVLNGKIQLVDEYDTHKKVLAELGPGEFFGEMSMVEKHHTHSLHAIVKEPSHLLVLENRVLNHLIDNDLPKQFLKNIIGVLCHRIYANKNMYMRARYYNKFSKDIKWQG
jgi:CRP-like cAMP-binding protein